MSTESKIILYETSYEVDRDALIRLKGKEAKKDFLLNLIFKDKKLPSIARNFFMEGYASIQAILTDTYLFIKILKLTQQEIGELALVDWYRDEERAP